VHLTNVYIIIIIITIILRLCVFTADLYGAELNAVIVAYVSVYLF